MPVTIPGQYNDQHITVSPDTMAMAARTVERSVLAITEALKTINTCLSELKLSWGGDTKEEAEAFFGNWSSLMENLYGDDGTYGLLPVLASNVKVAAYVYSTTENGIYNMFLNAFSASGDAQKKPESTMHDSTVSAVSYDTET